MTIIKKHQNDVFRLFRVLTPDTRLVLSSTMAENVKLFLDIIGENQLDL